MSGSEHIRSWYAASAPAFPRQPALAGTQRADVCILGAGITGLSTAIELARAGLSVIVLEAKRVAWGASGRSGGQAIFGFGCDQAKITQAVGLADSKRLFDWSLEGLDLIKTRCAEFGIDCDWRDGHAHVPIKPRHITELKAWQRDLADNFGYPLQWWEREQLQAVMPNERYLGALFDPRSGHLHPLKYTQGLAKAALALGVRIFEDSPVTALERGPTPRFKTAHGEVACDFAVLAGNAYVHGIAPELDAKIMPVGTYIGATAPLGEALARDLIRNDMAVADVNWALDYFRLSADHRLLFGGRASYSTLPPPDLAGTLRRRMTRVFPRLAGIEMEYVWGGYVDISLSRAPHWGRLGQNIYYAQGFSGHGIAATGLAGRILAEAIRGQAGRLDAFARIPHRDFPGGRLLRTPLLVAAMAWFKLRDALF
ncbi:FAD-dependent oxidoreductase [Arenimonas maotaiensis]|uniref:FAD-dependent oxidoreductase n=1 Tax=Arenimonas maotaiensis TaxID=1446479 RepID=A0A917CM20_9GAMM|nr:FAD-binding oxidoreductase [Arenimonas maotaiensis]GGF92878.1 FAD-dependent oxidoreductase [Arenimonas maotaiensis]